MPKVSCPYCGQAYSYETLGAEHTITCQSCNHLFSVAEPAFPPKQRKIPWILGSIVIILLLAGEACLFFFMFRDHQVQQPMPEQKQPVAQISPTSAELDAAMSEIHQLREELESLRKTTEETLQAHTDRLEQVKQFDSSTLEYINYFNNYFQNVEMFAAGQQQLNQQYENALNELYTVCSRQNEVLGLTANYAANGSVLGRLSSLENQVAALSNNYQNDNYNRLWRGWGTRIIIPNWNRPRPPKPPPKPPKTPTHPSREPEKASSAGSGTGQVLLKTNVAR